jgi:hypothetical protein
MLNAYDVNKRFPTIPDFRNALHSLIKGIFYKEIRKEKTLQAGVAKEMPVLNK